MLTSLYIENIAVIEKTNIDFTDGFNVLTGETGAGKSIIIDSINAVLGQRTSKDIIRTGAKSALVSASFNGICDAATRLLNNYGITIEPDDLLILQRELSATGKNVCRINDRPVTVSTLKDIAQSLINIHGQHETNEIMAPHKHIRYLDSYGGYTNLLDRYREEYSLMCSYKRELKKSVSDSTDRERKIDLLKYQIDEIISADISPEEYTQLTERKAILSNSEKIKLSLNEAYYILSGNEEALGVADITENAVNALSKATGYITEIEAIAERLNNASAELSDCASELADYLDQVDYNPQELEEIEEKLDLYYKLCKKYGPDVEDVLEFLENAQKELEYLEKYEFNRQALQDSYKKALGKTLETAVSLSQKRNKAADEFAKAVKAELVFLDMPKVEFTISNTECELNENGKDNIEMLISTNPGELPKPVAKIASGGELSRIMLAIKNVLSDKDSIDTLIFDEIDTGISGSAAGKVGQKLQQVAKCKQVICVTHQSQIAALANTHFLIKKDVKQNKTYTAVTPLDYDGRVQELSRLIDGNTNSQISIDHARAMLKQNL